MPQSARMFPLIGMNLLRLLADNRIAEFHMHLERIVDLDLLASNLYLKYAVQVEQFLMEGAYNRLLQLRQSAPSTEYAYLLETILVSVKTELASCIEVSYASMGVQALGGMLGVKDAKELMDICQQRNWSVDSKCIICKCWYKVG
jgi:26S proteasome regulatory subunit N12